MNKNKRNRIPLTNDLERSSPLTYPVGAIVTFHDRGVIYPDSRILCQWSGRVVALKRDPTDGKVTHIELNGWHYPSCLWMRLAISVENILTVEEPSDRELDDPFVVSVEGER